MSRWRHLGVTRIEAQDLEARELFTLGDTPPKYIAPTRRGIRSMFPSMRTLANIGAALAAMTDAELGT